LQSGLLATGYCDGAAAYEPPVDRLTDDGI
jgi:hypothetical protein